MKKILNWDVGVIELLALIFVAEKLVGKIGWSWVWVLCPLWLAYLGRAAKYLGVILLDWSRRVLEDRAVNQEEQKDGPGLRTVPKIGVVH